MPFGLPVWALLWGLTSLLLAASALVGNRWATRTSAVILASYVLVRVIYAFPISSDLQILNVAALWVVASCFVPLGGTGDKLAPLFVRAFMALSGACYLWARLTDAPRVFGSPPYVASDLLLIAAMLLIGWTLRHDIQRAVENSVRSRNLDRHNAVGGVRFGSFGNRCYDASEKEAAKVKRGSANV